MASYKMWSGCGNISTVSGIEAPSAHSQAPPFRKQLKGAAARRRPVEVSSGVKKSSKAQDALDEKWELTVGIEIHAQLNTERKLFSYATASIHDEPNSHVSVFDAALPGTQPAFQREALVPALRAAFALDCRVERTSQFDRKHYFYRDQPAGYQITQYYHPLARDGQLELLAHDGIAPEDGERVTIGIKQVQLEQDTAKTLQQPPSTHLLDLNRVSLPLIEIITLPHIHHPSTAAACVRKIQSTLKAVGACVLGMEVGGMRADVNVSVRRRTPAPGDEAFHHYHDVTGLGQRTEIKNLSSFKAVEDAIKAERVRQIRVLEAGGVVEGETRGWTLGGVETKKLRSKEGEVDYRYMPDPDLAPVILGEGLLDHISKTLPMLPDQQLQVLTTSPEFNLTAKDAKTLMALDDGERLDYYRDVVVAVQEELQPSPDGGVSDATIGRITGNWVLHELGGLVSTAEKTWDENPVSERALASILILLLRKDITGTTAKQLLSLKFHGDGRVVEQIVDEQNLRLRRMSEAEYEDLARKIVEENAGVVDQIKRKGKRGKLNHLVGQMMRYGEEGRVEAGKAEETLARLLRT
ncbi:MAG: hypothetical protein M1832_006117 [Thelocarpon impressellum]|nr:MAG: hypothetical protein M1832_006117 [Thelocarpon impressellum]